MATKRTAYVREVRCPIPGCEHRRIKGWHGHVGKLENHPRWRPDLEDANARRIAFLDEYPDYPVPAKTRRLYRAMKPGRRPPPPMPRSARGVAPSLPDAARLPAGPHPPTDEALEGAIVRAVMTGLGPVANTLAAVLEERRRARGTAGVQRPLEPSKKLEE